MNDIYFSDELTAVLDEMKQLRERWAQRSEEYRQAVTGFLGDVTAIKLDLDSPNSIEALESAKAAADEFSAKAEAVLARYAKDKTAFSERMSALAAKLQPEAK